MDTKTIRWIRRPRGVFEGNNFMTPTVLGYAKLHKGYAELSEGEGFEHEPIYGVTVRPEPEPRASKMFHSKRAALEYIEELS